MLTSGEWHRSAAGDASAASDTGLFNSQLGFGQKSAVIVVDFTKAYTTPGGPFYCPGSNNGYGVIDAVAESESLLKVARTKCVPIFYALMRYDHPADGGLLGQKFPILRTLTRDNPFIHIHESVAPQQGDSILVKQNPSVFFGTNLAPNLWAINVDTCIVIGCCTSGCIRASVLEGMQLGFRCIVPRECVGDYTEKMQSVSLFDMNSKSGDVVSKDVVMEYFANLSVARLHPSAALEPSAKRAKHETPPTPLSGFILDANKRDSASKYEGISLGFGQTSAVIVVDFIRAYTAPESKLYCPGKGYGVVDAVAESKHVLELARKKRVPIFYTVVYYEHPTDGGLFTKKIPILRTLTKDNPFAQIDDCIKPQQGDCLVVKQYPSAFFGTSLACNLRAIKVDTCIIVGCSTSGCIRATVLDGMQQGFRCIIPRECVGDRIESIHEANLLDMNAKNGDVVPKQQVIDYFDAL